MKHVLILEPDLDNSIGLMKLLNSQEDIVAIDIFPRINEHWVTKELLILQTIRVLRDQSRADLILISLMLNTEESGLITPKYCPPSNNLLLCDKIANEVFKNIGTRVIFMKAGVYDYSYKTPYLDDFLKYNDAKRNWSLIECPSRVDCLKIDFQNECRFNKNNCGGLFNTSDCPGLVSSNDSNLPGFYSKCYPAKKFNSMIRKALKIEFAPNRP